MLQYVCALIINFKKSRHKLSEIISTFYLNFFLTLCVLPKNQLFLLFLALTRSCLRFSTGKTSDDFLTSRHTLRSFVPFLLSTKRRTPALPAQCQRLQAFMKFPAHRVVEMPCADRKCLKSKCEPHRKAARLSFRLVLRLNDFPCLYRLTTFKTVIKEASFLCHGPCIQERRSAFGDSPHAGQEHGA